MIAQIAAILAPTAAATLVGWLWSRHGPGIDRRRTTDLIMLLGAPCLVFHGLVSAELDAAAMGEMAAASAAALLAFALVAAPILRLAHLELPTFLAPMVFGNAGNMGLPVCLFAFGPEGLALALVFFAVTSVVHFSLGIALWSGRISLAAIARTPLALAALLAVGVKLTDFPVPGWLLDTAGLLGGCAVPLMLLSLGAAIAELRVERLGRQAALAALRLGMGAGVGLGLSRLLGLEGVARGVLVLQAAMPVAVVNHLMAERYGRSPDDVAGVIVLSTLGSLLTFPLLLAHLLGS